MNCELVSIDVLCTVSYKQHTLQTSGLITTCPLGHVSHSSCLAKTILQGTGKGAEDKADRRIDGKTTSGNGQAWSLQSPREQWRTEKNGGNLF